MNDLLTNIRKLETDLRDNPDMSAHELVERIEQIISQVAAHAKNRVVIRKPEGIFRRCLRWFCGR